MNLQRAAGVARHGKVSHPRSRRRAGLGDFDETRLAVRDGRDGFADDDRRGAAAADPSGEPAVGCDDRLRTRSEEHTSELQSPCNLVCRLLLEKKKIHNLDLWLESVVALTIPASPNMVLSMGAGHENPQRPMRLHPESQ